MLVDGGVSSDLAHVAGQAKKVEADGYDGAWGSETSHDPFLPLALAAEHTDRLQLGTAIAVAFARSPMTLANTAWDLNDFSAGRFMLGLGSQIKPHIEKRFSMPWSHPAPRMKEFISALRAIWATWQDRVPLDFRGEFYRHTLMTPFFDPGPNEHGAPKVLLAAVGEGMTRVAGEVADGILVHGFTTERYLKEVTLPTVEAGLAASGRSRSDFTVSCPGFVVTGTTDEERARADVAVRKQIAFYGSTPAYRAVLELHGWHDLQPQLNALSKQGDWDGMGKLIDDEVLDAFAVVAEPDAVADAVLARFAGAVDRFSFYAPAGIDADLAGSIRAQLQGG
ncbi:MAG TPA: LLM class F420-dependent oxidoreductase [Acidimicrobiales bacterium]|nr:LLM class F420-dependent oxidoreductase [Acidimicrobiales bacterium]